MCIINKYASKLKNNYNYEFTEDEIEADHPPITPVANLKKMAKLEEGSNELKIFELVVMNFFASISVDAQYNFVKTSFEVEGKRFNETH